MAKTKELRALGEPELQSQLAKAREELAALRLKAAQGTVEQPHKIRQIRKDVARMLTLLNEKPSG